MKAIKRTVAALLATLMLATSTSFTLAAENYSNKEAVVVAKVQAAKIMTGTDKGFEPSKSLTRAEAAAIIVRMKGISESAVKTAAGTTLFNDVAAAHWASGYVNQASNLGIVKGVSATEFAPEREVTVAEFTTMAVRALGAGQLVDAEGTWPTNYVNFANEEGILDEVNAVYTAVATRLQAATVVANTLETEMWAKTKATTNNEITWEKQDNKTLLSEVLNIAISKDVTFDAIDTKNGSLIVVMGNYVDTSAENPAAPDPDHESDDFSLSVAEDFALGNIKAGLVYDLWYNTKEKEVVGIWDAEDSKLTKVSFEDVKKSSAKEVTFIVDGKEVKYDVKDGATATLNNAASTVATLHDDDYAVSGYAYLDGKKVKSVFAEKFTEYGVVSDVTDTRIKFNSDYEGTTVNSISVTDSNEYIVTKDGKSIDVEDVKEDDVLFYYVENITGANSYKRYTMVVFNDEVEGKVKTLNKTSDYVTINSEKVYYVGVSETGLASGNEIKGYLNTAGKIVLYDKIEGIDGDYAVISDIRIVNAKEADKFDLEVKLSTMDGTMSDWTVVDITKSTEKTHKLITKATAKLVMDTANDGAAAEIAIGDLVRYELKSGKVVFTDTVDPDGNDFIVELLSSKTNDFTISSKKASSVTVDKAVGGTNAKFYLTNSTKIVKVKEVTVDNRDIVKLEVLNIDELDSSNDITGYIADIDYEEKEVELLVISDGINRISEAKFGFVLAVDDDYEDDEDEDASVLYQVLYADGSVEDLIADKEIEVTGLFANADASVHTDVVAAGQFYEFSFEGGKVVEANTPVDTDDEVKELSLTADSYISKEYENGIELGVYGTSNDGTFAFTNERLALAEELIVVKYDSAKGEFKAAKYDDIKLLDNITYPGTSDSDEKLINKADFANAEANSLYQVYTYDDGEGEEVVVIIYNK